MVVSMSASVCALETNPASNAEGARNTPRASAARCQRANRLASAALASAKFLTGPGAKYIPHIEPACPVVTGTPCRRAAFPIPATSRAVPDVRLDDHGGQRVTPSPEQLAEGAAVVEGQREGETGKRGGDAGAVG